jgi:molecular chaperone GrpE
MNEETQGAEEEKLPTETEQEATLTLPQAQWEALQNELKEAQNKYLLLLADGENTRKRMIKEREENSDYAVANAICDFLSPMDNLENALGYADKMSDEVKNWALGFQMILTQFKEALASNGVVTVKSVGELFDPNIHEAIETEYTTKQAPGTILEEYAKGYKRGKRTIRPARVKVAKAPESTEEAPDVENFLMS